MKEKYKRLLYVCDYPPSIAAGAPVIARQLLLDYPSDALTVLCGANWHVGAAEVVRGSFLPCRHIWIPSFQSWRPRPRRISSRLMVFLDFFRVRRIVAAGRRICVEQKIEAIFAPLYSYEFGMAASKLASAFGIELFLFETDDWAEASRSEFLLYWAIRRAHLRVLESAAHCWFTSPAMVRERWSRFGIRGEFLFNYVNMDRYLQAKPSLKVSRTAWNFVYTGSINQMSADTMQTFCGVINRGVVVDGLPVVVTIYTNSSLAGMLGNFVHHGGYVSSEQLPRILMDADASFLCLSFSQRPKILRMVQTSLYTKTIDYLAAGRPVLIISPEYTAEASYFSDVTQIVNTSIEHEIIRAIERVCRGGEEVAAAVRRGMALVSQYHSRGALMALHKKYFIASENEP